MKRKVIAAVGISGLLMVGGVLSASASTSGYDLFKSSLKKTHDVQSLTAHVEGTLQDNGKVVYQINSLAHENFKSDVCSTSISVKNGDKVEKVDLQNENQQLVVKSSNDDNYYVKQGNKWGKWRSQNNKHKQVSPQMQQQAEAIFDSFTKNYQDKIVSKDLANGNTGLELDLSKNEIPTVGQAMVSFFLENADQHSKHWETNKFGSFQFTDFKPQLTKLANNVSISRVVVQGEVNPDGFLVGQELTVYISGDDVSGTHHDLVFHLTNKLDKINNTNVPSLDLKGKTIVNVKDNQEHQRW